MSEKINAKINAIDIALKNIGGNEQQFKSFYNQLTIKGSTENDLIEAIEYILPYADYVQRSMITIWRFTYNKKLPENTEVKDLMKAFASNYYVLRDYLEEKKKPAKVQTSYRNTKNRN